MKGNKQLKMTNILAAACVLALAAVSLAAGQNAADYSEAQMLLFANQHLKNVHSKAVLHYDFHQSGSDADKIDDRVTLEITGMTKRGGKSIRTVFLNGPNNRPYPEVPDFLSNPLIMFFLQWDVEKMESAGKVTSHYFRHLIRNALATEARSKSITVPGTGIKGMLVTLQPFKSVAEKSEKYRSLGSKRYEFVIAESVPGGIHSIKTVVPGSGARDKPKEYTEMTFNRIEPKNAFSNHKGGKK